MRQRGPLRWISGVAGADEAGRGPLAGPVVAAAVLLPDGFDIAELNDSKKLDRPTRERLCTVIEANARVEVEFAEIDEIDRRNILHASEAALARAINRLGAARVMVDGHRVPPGIAMPAEAVIRGDGEIAAIAAASIVAKVRRDALMTEFAGAYPDYGFDRHFGYPTPEHLEVLRQRGPCPIHRRSFGPVRDWDAQPCLIFAP